MASVPTQTVLDYIQENAKKYGVDPETAKQILLAENIGRDPTTKQYRIPSTLDTEKSSPAGATGLMQVMPATHKNLIAQGYLPADHSMDTWDAQLNAGLAALKAMQKEQGTTDPTVLAAAYNAGPSGAKLVKAGQVDKLPAETSNYLQKIEAAKGLMTPAGATPAPAPAVRGTLDQTYKAYADTLMHGKQDIDTLISSFTSNATEAEAARLKAAEQTAKAGTAAGTVAALKGTIEAQTEATRERGVRLLKLDTSDPNNVIATELTKQMALEEKMAPLEKDISARMGVGFFDNPIAWLVNQTVLPGQVEQYNAMARSYNDSQTLIDRRQHMANAQKTIDVAGVTDLITKQSLAQADFNVASANAKAAELRADASAGAAAKVMGIARLKSELTGRELGLHDLAVRIESLQDNIQNRDEKKRLVAEVDTEVKKVGMSIGSPNVSYTGLLRRGKDVLDEWLSAATNNTYGKDFGSAINFIQKYGNREAMSRGDRAEFSIMTDKMFNEIQPKATEIYVNQKTLYPGTKAFGENVAFDIAAADYRKSIVASRETNMINASATNPYKINHVLTNRTWAGNPNNVVNALIKQMESQGIAPTDGIVVEELANLVRMGKVDPQIAAAHSAEYFIAGIARNNKTRDYKAIQLEPQTNYKVIPRGSKVPVDLTNRGSAENYFITQAITARARAADQLQFEIAP